LKEDDDPQIQQSGTYKRLLKIAMNFRFVILSYKPKLVELLQQVTEQKKQIEQQRETIHMLRKARMILENIIDQRNQQDQLQSIKRSAACKKAWDTRRQKEEDAKFALLEEVSRSRREMEKFMAPDPDDEDDIYEDGIGNSDDDIWGLEAVEMLGKSVDGVPGSSSDHSGTSSKRMTAPGSMTGLAPWLWIPGWSFFFPSE
jgi:Zn-dependent M32 family carboxypeptidase